MSNVCAVFRRLNASYPPPLHAVVRHDAEFLRGVPRCNQNLHYLRGVSLKSTPRKASVKKMSAVRRRVRANLPLLALRACQCSDEEGGEQNVRPGSH